MIDLSWTIEDDRATDLTDSPRPLLSTWHYLRSALRRRWRTTVGLGLLGALLGVGFVVLMPPGSTATVTVLMAHPANMDGPDRGAMDLSLLSTREVADRTVRALGLPLTPEAFLATVSAEPVTPEVLTIKVSGPDDASATSRAQELVRQYLAFRGAQLTSLSSGLRSEYTARIASAQQQVTALTTQFEQLSAKGGQSASQAFDVLARRSDLNKKIADWQETLDDATVQTDAALQSTHVIDPVHVDRASTKRAMALAGASGLIAGTALGAGAVVFRALVSERLRRRKDIGIALGTSVRFGVRSRGTPRGSRGRLERLAPPRGRPAVVPGRSAGWRGADLETLVHGLESVAGATADPAGDALSALRPVSTATNGELRAAGVSSNGTRRGPACAVALAAVGNPRAAADVLAAAAARAVGRGTDVFLVDLSTSGALVARAEVAGCEVHRPTGTPGLAHGPRGTGPSTFVDLAGESWKGAWASAALVLALVEVDPGIEVEHLTTWVDQVIPLVSSGAATAELLSTTGDLIREAGLELPFAMMVGCDVTDESLGLLLPAEAEITVGSAG